MAGRTLTAPWVLWLALTGAALALSGAAASRDTLPGDTTIAESLQDWPLPGQDLSDAVRAITGTETVLATGAAVSLILWLRGHRLQALLLLAGLAALAFVQFGVKELVDRPRPSAELVDIRAGHSSPSFPSGHVMSATFLYGFLVYLSLTLPLARSAAVPVAGASALVIVVVGPVNVWLGVHWPSDVLGAWLLSAWILIPFIVIDRRAPGS